MPDERKIVIAIDGPAGAGKSTIASRLARKFGYVNLESGAMYRALALKAIERDIGFDDEAALLDLAQRSKIELQPRLDGNRVLLDGRDVSARIRERDVTEAASARVSASVTSPRLRRKCRCIRRCAPGWWRASVRWASRVAWSWKGAISGRRCFPTPK